MFIASRLTRRVLLWDRTLSEEGGLKTWFSELKSIAVRNNLTEILNDIPFDIYQTVEQMKISLLTKDQSKWSHEAGSMPKLRTYVTISDFSVRKSYITKPLSFIQRKYLAKFRLGILPIRIETGRYERPKLVAAERTCQICNSNTVEDETHFLLYCPKFSTLRERLFSFVEDPNFENMGNQDKMKFLTNDSSMVKTTAQYLIDAFDLRSKII